MDKCWKELPSSLTQRILYEVLILLENESLLQFYNGITPCFLKNSILFPNRKQKYIQFNAFSVLQFKMLTDRNFINITKNKSLISSIIHRINFDFNSIEFLNSIIEQYVLLDDRHQCLIAGGYFSRYTKDSLIGRSNPDLFTLFSQHTDIDIFLMAPNISEHLEFLMSKGLHCYGFHVLNCNNTNSPSYFGYKFTSWKLKTQDNILLNFVAVNIAIYPSNDNVILHGINLKQNIYTPFDYINDFDLDFSKIFYSPFFNSVFVHATFFQGFFDLCSFYEVVPNIKDFSYYKRKMITKKAFMDSLPFDEFKYQICFNASENRFFKFIVSDFVYFLKYCMKGYIFNLNEESEYLALIKMFVLKFKNLIFFKYENSDNYCNTVVDVAYFFSHN